MMLGIIGPDGKLFPPYWCNGTVDTKQYKYLLSHKVFPVLNSTYGVENWVWTQDGAPAHTCNSTQKYLLDKLGSEGFWSKDLWPPNSLNLNPLDYYLWSTVEKEACASYHPNETALKASVEAEWDAISLAMLQSVCSRFRSRLERCISADGGIFEKV